MLSADPTKTTAPHPPIGRAFDTLAFAKRMETVGFTRQQAEALADEQGKFIDERLATKTDIELVRADLATGLAKTKAEIIIWVAGLLVAQTSLVFGVIKFHG
jgi:hypothetical protein